MSNKKLVLSKQQIAERVQALGHEITSDYKGKKLVLLGVLNGAFIFFADLCRSVEMDLEVDFIRVASYGDATHSSGTIRLSKPTEIDFQNKDIIIVEDIVDTGRTMAWLINHFAEMGASSVKVCTLIDKSERREVEVQVDYAGFKIDKGYLIGYGMDCAEVYRNLPEIYELVF